MSFTRKQIIVRSQDRDKTGSDSATDFTYTLPFQIRDVVHTNLLHCCVENGIYNIDDTNNNLVLSMNSTDNTNIDFPYQGRGCVSVSNSTNDLMCWVGVGVGPNALMSTLYLSQGGSGTAFPPTWSKKSITGKQWTDTTELTCVDSRNQVVLVGGNNTISQGYIGNLFYAPASDTNIVFEEVVGGPSTCVNSVSIGASMIAVGNDSASQEFKKIKIDSSINQLIVRKQTNNFYKSNTGGNLIIQVKTGGTWGGPYTIPDVPATTYSINTYCEAVNNSISANFPVTEFSIQLVPVTQSQFQVVIHPNGPLGNLTAVRMWGSLPATDWGITDMYTSESFPAYPEFGGQSLFYTALSGGSDIIIPAGFYPTVNSPFQPLNPPINPFINIVALNSSQIILVDDGVYTIDALASLITYNISAYGGSVVPTVTSSNNKFVFSSNQDPALKGYIVSIDQFSDPTNADAIALGNLMGLTTAMVFTQGGSTAENDVAFNYAVQYPVWTSSDGTTWNRVLDDYFDGKIAYSCCTGLLTSPSTVSLVGGNGWIAATSDAWTTKTVFTTYYDVYDAVQPLSDLGNCTAIKIADSDNDMVVFGFSNGAILYLDNSVGPTLHYVNTLNPTPSGKPACVTGITLRGVDGNAIWVIVGSGIAYSTGVKFTVDTVLSYVPTDSLPNLDPIQGASLSTLSDSTSLQLLAVGNNIGDLSCFVTNTATTLDDWTSEKDFEDTVLIQLPIGYYTNALLGLTLETIFNEVSTLSTGKFYVEVMTNGNLDISHTTSTSWGIIFNYGDYIFSKTATTLGFQKTDSYYRPFTYEGNIGPFFIESDIAGGVNLRTYEYVLVKSDKFGNDLISKSVPAWWFVPNEGTSANPNSIMYENVRPPVLQFLNNPRDISQFDIKITDPTGEVINIADNQNSTLVIEFYCKPAQC